MTRPTTRDDIVALFDRRQEAWQRRDPAALAADHAENGVAVSPMFGTVTGRAAIEGAYRALFAAFPDWTLRSEELAVDLDRVAQMFTVEATHVGEFFGLSATGRRFEIKGVLWFRFKDGQIVHERRIYDFTSLLLQIGVLKAKPV